MSRRGFLSAALAAAGGIALAILGAPLRAARAFRIPVKPFDPARLREPHDLAG